MDLSTDLMIFGKQIAPTLSITKRFVGEELTDNITLQYNIQMKKILPEYGVDVIEIPRASVQNGDIISATVVRKLFLDRRWDLITDYVTNKSKDFLINIREKF